MKRELWLDYSRAFACILVAVGHLLMSFKDAGIISENIFVDFLISFIYLFHVYVFFFCSGYLFQKSFEKQKTKKEYRKNEC